jgi:hypothetical protein
MTRVLLGLWLVSCSSFSTWQRMTGYTSHVSVSHRTGGGFYTYTTPCDLISRNNLSNFCHVWKPCLIIGVVWCPQFAHRAIRAPQSKTARICLCLFLLVSVWIPHRSIVDNILRWHRGLVERWPTAPPLWPCPEVAARCVLPSQSRRHLWKQNDNSKRSRY